MVSFDGTSRLWQRLWGCMADFRAREISLTLSNADFSHWLSMWANLHPRRNQLVELRLEYEKCGWESTVPN